MRNSSGRKSTVGAVLSTAVLFCTPLNGAELSETPEHAGKTLYRQYCTACHGPQGKGDGTLAEVLTRKPADLTNLARKAGGKFPFWETMRIIDGTRTVRAHGDAEMPVWGQVFRDEAAWGMARRAEVQGKLTFLTDYLRTIQEK